MLEKLRALETPVRVTSEVESMLKPLASWVLRVIPVTVLALLGFLIWLIEKATDVLGAISVRKAELRVRVSPETAQLAPASTLEVPVHVTEEL